MKIINEDLLANKADYICFTANAVITRQGKLVMGRGAALRVRDAFPGIDACFGQKLALCRSGIAKEYGICDVFYNRHHIIAVQVKRHFSDYGEKACWDLCWWSLLKLHDQFVSPMPGMSFRMNMPLIGFCGCSHLEDKIRQKFEELFGHCNNFTICRFGEYKEKSIGN